MLYILRREPSEPRSLEVWPLLYPGQNWSCNLPEAALVRNIRVINIIVMSIFTGERYKS